jgi:putative DNA primase/helicase
MNNPFAPIEEPATTAPAEEYVPVLPMPEPYRLPTHRLGKPDEIYEYRTADGGLAFVVCRWHATDKRRKGFAQCTWNGSAYVWKLGRPPVRPLLNAPEIVAHPSAPVLIVEGEKTARGAAAYLPPGWLVTTWQGGANAIPYADFKILRGHRCVFWPDNDEPGFIAAAQLVERLEGLSIPCGSIAATKLRAFPPKWDLADALPQNITAEAITQQLVKHAPAVATIERPRDEEEPPPLPRGVDPDRRFSVLGYNEQRYYIIPSTSQQVHEYTAAQLLRREAILEINPDIEYWSAQYGGDVDKIPWVVIGTDMIAACTRAGIYRPDKIRGRGAWWDDSRIVVHMGEYLLVDGSPTTPSALDSRWFYPRALALLDGPTLPDPLSDDEAAHLLKTCQAARWDRAIYGDFLAGWIATAVVTGALRWRTHVWLTGAAGSGKSYLTDSIVGAALGDLAIYPVGITSEAGIRQALEKDARPVVYDEAEGRGQAGIARREAVIELMRQAAHEGRGQIFKGSAGHSGVQFAIRSQFLLASIGVGLREAADEGRTVVLTLKGQEAFTDEARAQQAAHFARLRQMVARLPRDLPERLFSRMVGLLPVLRANIETFSEVIALQMGGRRIGDQLGTLLAGAYALRFSDHVKTEAAAEYVRRQIATGAFDDFTRSKEVREDLDVIRYLAAQTVRVTTTRNTSAERAIGELVGIAGQLTTDDLVDSVLANQHLRRYGLRCEGEGVWLARQHPGLESLMRGSDYAQGFIRIIERHPQAQLSARAVRFAGVQQRAVWVPIGEFAQAGSDTPPSPADEAAMELPF